MKTSSQITMEIEQALQTLEAERHASEIDLQADLAEASALKARIAADLPSIDRLALEQMRRG